MTEEAAPAPQPAKKATAKKQAVLRICDWCGSPFSAPVRRGPVLKYCKPGCKQRAYEERTRQKELAAIHGRHEKQLDRIFGALGKNTAAKARKAADESQAEPDGPGPVIEGQEELTW